MSLAAGLALALAFPTHNLYWLAPVGVALLSAAVLGASWRLAGPLGLTAGLAFFVPTLSWSGVYVGALPWIALCVLQSLYIAAMTALTAAVQRPLLATRLRPLAYAAVPVFWVLQETARSHTPFGGFPWARLAFSQADSPLAHLAAYAGARESRRRLRRWGRCSTPGGPCSSGERAAAPAHRRSAGAPPRWRRRCWRSPPCRHWPRRS